MPRLAHAMVACALLAPVAAVAAPGAARSAPLVVLYAPAAGADAVHDGSPGLPGVHDALRQAPAVEDPRFPRERRIGKVSGRTLARLSAPAMARALRAGWSERSVGGRVAVDEVGAADYTVARMRTLRVALGLLGPDADRVILYMAPGLMQRVGRVDRRRALPALETETVRTAADAGHTYLTTYQGGVRPMSREALARDLTGWVARWPADRIGRLHVILGREEGVTQAEIWDRVRATPAGRTLLSNGPGAYGLRDAGEGRRWLREYRTFLADPAAPPAGGAARVPEGGGLTLGVPSGTLRTGAPVTVGIARPGRAVVQLVPLPRGRSRAIRVLTGPVTAAVPVPRDVRPGRYEIRVTLLGDGIRDVARRRVVVRRAPPAVPLRIAVRGRAVAVTVGASDRAVVRVVPRGGRARVVAKITGPARSRVVALPADLRPGPHTVIAVTAGAGGRQEARARVVIPPRR